MTNECHAIDGGFGVLMSCALKRAEIDLHTNLSSEATVILAGHHSMVLVDENSWAHARERRCCSYGQRSGVIPLA